MGGKSLHDKEVQETAAEVKRGSHGTKTRGAEDKFTKSSAGKHQCTQHETELGFCGSFFSQVCLVPDKDTQT